MKKELAASIGIAVALGGAMVAGEHVKDISVHVGEKGSEAEVDFTLDGEHCHVGSHKGRWVPHVRCPASGLDKEL